MVWTAIVSLFRLCFTVTQLAILSSEVDASTRAVTELREGWSNTRVVGTSTEMRLCKARPSCRAPSEVSPTSINGTSPFISVLITSTMTAFISLTTLPSMSDGDIFCCRCKTWAVSSVLDQSNSTALLSEWIDLGFRIVLLAPRS